MVIKKAFTYIDLFAGIGGFHLAMDIVSEGNAKCIFACEIDPKAAKVYHDNFGIQPLGDIREIDPSKYEAPDVVCGGFPCQTFSKAGKQDGLKDSRGTLFREIIRIIEFYPSKKRPKLLILENVRNLVTHDNGETWKTIRFEIERAGYNICLSPIIIAPKDLGVPQLRDRAIIVAVRNDFYSGKIDVKIDRKAHNLTSIFDIISDDIKGSRFLTDEEKLVLDCWNEFILNIGAKPIGFPIWSDYFGTNVDIAKYPDWKVGFVNKNIKLYENNRSFIDSWMKKWKIRQNFTATNRKFEWQCGAKISNIYDGIIQFRTSGIRVKNATESPALVAMVHLPIIGKLKRTISIKEAARLQCFPDNFKFDESPQLAFKQLGNAVNVKVISHTFKEFLKAIKFIMED